MTSLRRDRPDVQGNAPSPARGPPLRGDACDIAHDLPIRGGWESDTSFMRNPADAG